MKKLVLMFAAILALAAPMAFAAEHGGHGGGRLACCRGPVDPTRQSLEGGREGRDEIGQVVLRGRPGGGCR